VPQIGRLGPGERSRVFDASDGHNAQVFDPTHRYAWPAEEDLMAQLAGFELDQRWANWQLEPFAGQSTARVSVWRKPAL
jgi:hypothetical protein